MDESNVNKQRHEDFACTGCGGSLKFIPGSTTHIKCQFCGADNEIPVMEGEPIEEFDFHEYLSKNKEMTNETTQVTAVKCSACGAQSTMPPNVTSSDCPFCATPLVVSNGSLCDVIKPKAVLPFKIERNKGNELFKNWINKLWFAPNDLKVYAQHFEKLHGMYIPYWTYDSDTYSQYTGQRGINYQTTETYTDSNGNRQTRTVTKTRWYNVSGSVSNNFDDVLVLASNSLPRNITERLEPWDLENLQPYHDRFLLGYQTETYQVDLEKGFDFAQKRMDEEIRRLVRNDIGGDQQRIFSVNTRHSNVTFKHVLLPLWISSYRYNQKVYRFLINARTGEVQGQRPYSAIKIILFCLMIIGIIGGFIYLGNQQGWFK